MNVLLVVTFFYHFFLFEYVCINLHKSVLCVQMRCCGGVDASDWKGSLWSNRTQHPQHTGRQFVVPDSCCYERGDESNSHLDSVVSIHNTGPLCRDDLLTPADRVSTCCFFAVSIFISIFVINLFLHF